MLGWSVRGWRIRHRRVALGIFFCFCFSPLAFVALLLLLLLFNKEGVVSPGLFAAIFMFMRDRSFGAVSRFVVDTFIDCFDVTKDFVS